ncbi:MAG: tRNA glutamyl-Q(34) synthetase GluQRS [Dehalococcoidia bacterium]
MSGNSAYTGRFAPSPTGPLHFGSLLAAIASFLQAKMRSGGRWLLRIEDIDPPREQPGADAAILRALETYGFEWDGAVSYQSRSSDKHRAALASLMEAGHAYRCSCSRQDLSATPRGPLGAIYPGTCRNGCRSGDTAIRVITHDRPVIFNDLLQGQQSQRLESESGDFVIQRRDALIAYHLAVVVDDFEQGISEVVRGVDLLDSTPRQIHLQRLLGYRTPAYAHIPVAVHPDGQKLSKLTGAAPISLDVVQPTLVAGLQALGQGPPAGLEDADLRDIWKWALANWRIEPLAGHRSVAEPDRPA